MFIQNFIESIKNNNPFVFVKYGDGEYFVSIGRHGANCDGTPYTNLLSIRVKESITYFSTKENAYCGKWKD